MTQASETEDEAAGPVAPGGAPLASLTVAFSTRGGRALGLRPADWPRAAGLDYLVLVQEPSADPALMPSLTAAVRDRPDVALVPLATTGLARSRNTAIALARGEVLLIADDDVRHLPGAFAGIRRFFTEDPGADLLVGRSLDPTGAPRKRYADQPRPLTLWNSGRVSSHELAFRLAPVREADLRFDERFGVGAGTPNVLGEEYIFLADCLRAGLRGNHLPLAVTEHPAWSSGLAWQGAAAARARSAVFSRVFGPAAPLVRLGFGVKNYRRFGSAWNFLRFVRG